MMKKALKEQTWMWYLIIVLLLLLLVGSNRKRPAGFNQITPGEEYFKPIVGVKKSTELHIDHIKRREKNKSHQLVDTDGLNIKPTYNQTVVFQQRKELLRTECDRRSIPYNLNDVPLLYIPESNLSYCMLSKTGTTTWAEYLTTFLNIPDGFNKKLQNKHILLRDAFPMPSDLSLVRNTTSFLFVRHPFVRFMSSYRMFAREDPRSETDSVLQRKIPGLKSSLSDPFVLFTSFIELFLSKNDTDWVNIHFEPFYYRCPVCLMDVDFVGKVETNEEDTLAIIESLGFPDRKETRHSKRMNVRGGIDSETMALDYFSRLQRSQVEALYRKYELDFILFGYEKKALFE